MSTDLTELFGEVIHSYTRAQAIEDGTLVDVSELAREAGFTWPVAMTRTAWAEAVEWNDSNRGCQDETGRLWDVLMMAHFAIKRSRGGLRLPYEIVRVPNTARATVPRLCRLVLHSGPGDNAEPVLTIMLPGED